MDAFNSRPLRVGGLGTVFRQVCIHFWEDESGQDLIEYGLLTAIVSVATVLAFGSISGKMGNAYNSWNTATQNRWEPCAPASSGLPCP